ncbi:phytoene/squalene synthase family protein [Chelatococcus reniformis]|uniref:Phytoene synthase n=1 Tax=Chelatococcus reniformis TaxID=1494448 RepID=A0A916U0N9_9HYPH|nr:phytoene/squalene synthase family protein [Chelatococcus reniformis]GGC55879.1 phytoene synthase [Chelatococcus reniformis]
MAAASEPERLEAAFGHCQALLREGDRDRYLAILLAPPHKRAHLSALYAFSLDVARIREVAAQALAGEIRLQWWRDAVMGDARGEVSAHPIAAALLATIAAFRLPPQAFLDLLDARTFDLYDDPMPTVASLEGYCGETSSALLRLASFVLADGRDPGGADAAGHAGVAYAIAGLLRAFPWHARRGQVYLPADVLDRHAVSRSEVVSGTDSDRLRAALADMRTLARRHFAQYVKTLPTLPPVVRMALVPAAVAPLYLDRMEAPRYDPFGTVVEVPQWRRQWRLWRAAR